jgi:hypothetical protein
MKTSAKNKFGRREGRKTHRFTLLVKTFGPRKSAALDVLTAFAKRDPDGSEFHLLKR